MEHLIASYLFQHKQCPLPGIGQLALSEKPALIAHGAKQIYPPQPAISLISGDYQAGDFLAYVCAIAQISSHEASAQLARFCNSLHSLDSYAELKIPDTGKFYVNAEGNLVFKQATFLPAFLDTIHAEKVIHPDTTHSILVGDKESNSNLMTEYYNEADAAPRQKWWIAALVLAIAGFLIISIYVFNDKNRGFFGNATRPAVHDATQTYSTPK